MFTGIIERQARIVAVGERGACRRVEIRTPSPWKLALGQSVCVDGICSTVIARGRRSFAVEYMPETLKKTTAGGFRKNRTVNLERSLVYGSRVEGHLVQGHVDHRARVAALVETGRTSEIVVALPRAYLSATVLHGSVAINGVSLTIAGRGRGMIRVALIPHTLTHTTLGSLAVGDEVNVETDHSLLLRSRGRGTVGDHAAQGIRTKGTAARRVAYARRHRRL